MLSDCKPVTTEPLANTAPMQVSGRGAGLRAVGVTAGFHGRPRTESRVHGRATDKVGEWPCMA
jgi:hypothetical protein